MNQQRSYPSHLKKDLEPGRYVFVVNQGTTQAMIIFKDKLVYWTKADQAHLAGRMLGL